MVNCKKERERGEVSKNNNNNKSNNNEILLYTFIASGVVRDREREAFVKYKTLKFLLLFY